MHKLRIVALVVFLVLLTVPAVAQTDSPLPGELPPPPAAEDTTLENLLIWLVSGGCAVVTFWYLKREPSWFERLESGTKQAIASVISGGLAVAGFVGLVALGVEVEPASDLVAWFDALAPVFMFGAGAAKLVHGYSVLGKSG